MNEMRASLFVMDLSTKLYGGKLGDKNDCGVGSGDEGTEQCMADGIDGLDAERESLH